MRPIYTFFFVFFFVTTSLGQTFTLPELIKMSKMDVDNFDTYVTAKGFVFSNEDVGDNHQGVEYAFNLDRTDRTKALKFLTLYQRYYFFKYAISYQTINKKEYLAIKNQIKALGFKLEESNFHKRDEDTTSNHFVYKKGKARISIFASSKDFEINYQVDY